MILIVVLIALVIERFFDWSHLRNWHWYYHYQAILIKQFAPVLRSAYALLALIVVPILVIICLLDYLFLDVAFNLIEAVFHLFILLYCFGPRNFWADTFSSLNALTHAEPTIATEKLKNTFDIKNAQERPTMYQHFLEQIFLAANHRVFAVVFWFALLGPAGAILYRMVALSWQNKTNDLALSLAAHKVLGILDWLPIRLLTFIFALSGQFVKVFSIWKRKALLGIDANESLLIDCGAASLDLPSGDSSTDGRQAEEAMSLLDRAFIIILVMIAIGVLLV